MSSKGPQLSDDGRFWLDGDKWRPVPTAAPASGGVSVGKIVAGILIAVVIIGAVVLAFKVMTSSNDAVDCAIRNSEHAQNGEPLEDCPQ